MVNKFPPSPALQMTIQKRIYWRLAKGNLEAMLELFYGDDEGWTEIKEKVNEFVEYMEKESPIS
jgi:hypothetical protein